MSAMPNVVATLRAVEPIHRSLGLGIESIILRYLNLLKGRFFSEGAGKIFQFLKMPFM